MAPHHLHINWILIILLHELNTGSKNEHYFYLNSSFVGDMQTWQVLVDMAETCRHAVTCRHGGDLLTWRGLVDMAETCRHGGDLWTWRGLVNMAGPLDMAWTCGHGGDL